MQSIVIPEKSVPGLSLPVLGLGCYFFGHSTDNDLRDIELIRRAYRLGVRHFDVATRYGIPKEQGRAETVLGQALEAFPRNTFSIATKILPQFLGRKQLLVAFERSLTRLQTDYVDILMPHNPSTKRIPLGETLDVLRQIRQEKLAINIGLSQFTCGEHLEEAIRLAPGLITYAQFRYNVAFRDFLTDGTIELCRRNGILVVAYRPFYQGLLLEGVHPSLLKVAQKHGKTPSQVCLQWLTLQPGIVTIFGTTSTTHLEENLSSLEGSRWLDEHDLAELAKIPRIHPR